MSAVFKGFAALITLALAGVWLLPQWAPVQAVSWSPPPNPGLTGVFSPNQALAELTLMPVGPAPEHVACDNNGVLYTGLDGGYLAASVIGRVEPIRYDRGQAAGSQAG